MDSTQMNSPTYQTVGQERRKKGISGSTVKIIAVVTMLIDHLAAAVLTRMVIERGYFTMVAYSSMSQIRAWMAENGLLYYGMMLMRLIGRLGFPIFCFLLVEGFQKTRNIKKYAFRLGLFALISEVPFDLAFAGRAWYSGYQNVYFTLLIGILALWAFDAIAKHDLAKGLQVLLTVGGILLMPFYATLAVRSFVTGVMVSFFAASGGLFEWNIFVLAGIYLVLAGVMLAVWGIYRHVKGSEKAWRMCGCLAALAVAMTVADLLKTDYSGMGVLTIAVMYALRKNKVGCMAGGCAVLTVMSFSEATSFLALIPAALYNGERGMKMKYFFYAFYPVHLLILWLICWALGMGWMSTI